MDDVGIFRTTIEVQNLAMRGSRRALPETLVDTGSEYNWVPRRVRGTGRHHAPRRSFPRRAEPEDRSRTKGIGAGRAGDHGSGLGLNDDPCRPFRGSRVRFRKWYPRRALNDNNDTTAIAFAVLGPRAVEIDVPGSDCVAQAAEQMVQEQRLGVRRFRVPHVGVPRAPAIEIVVPAHGVMSAVRAALVARFIDLDEHVNGRIDRLEVVELVVATEASRQALCRYVRRVEH